MFQEQADHYSELGVCRYQIVPLARTELPLFRRSWLLLLFNEKDEVVSHEKYASPLDLANAVAAAVYVAL